MREFFEVIGVLLGMIMIFVIIVIPTLYIGEKKSCTNYETITSRTTKYMFFGGCFVETKNGWLTKKEYGQVIIAREGLLSK